MGIKDAVRYPTILFGSSYFFLSLGLALISMKAELEREELKGTLTPGSHFLYSDRIITIVDCNLTLYSKMQVFLSILVESTILWSFQTTQLR